VHLILPVLSLLPVSSHLKPRGIVPGQVLVRIVDQAGIHREQLAQALGEVQRHTWEGVDLAILEGVWQLGSPGGGAERLVRRRGKLPPQVVGVRQRLLIFALQQSVAGVDSGVDLVGGCRLCGERLGSARGWGRHQELQGTIRG
jgi:hypothetical protein